jgi:hypothetical protein
MKQHEVTIELDEHGHGKVMLDGQELNTTHIAFDSPAGKPPHVTFTVPARVKARLRLAEDQHLSRDEAGAISAGGLTWNIEVADVEVLHEAR